MTVAGRERRSIRAGALLDVNRTNARTRAARAAEAARAVVTTWMVWLRGLMIARGFFG
jgi:hypothetical protein